MGFLPKKHLNKITTLEQDLQYSITGINLHKDGYFVKN